MNHIKFLSVLAILFFSMNSESMSESSVEVKLQEASTAYSSGKYAESVKFIEEALEEVRLKAPMVIENFYPVRREAPYFSAFEPRANNIYESNEVLYFYLEPKNIVFVKKGETYTGGFFPDLSFKDDKGEALLEQKKFLDAEFDSRNPVHDLYTNITLNLTGVPPGTYKAVFTVRDQNSDKSASVEKEIIIQ
ncbi:MAG TPA: hypothetical protein VNN20_00030 [Thermodesulfobacteriota bacterium]|nr:hypothetical protein [Thermodesulfobacteriota bacterium]